MSRGQRADPAEIYGDNYKQDNKGKQRLGFNEAAVRQPKPYGAEGRGVEVKEADDYLDDVEAKLAKMYNRNKHAEVLDASAKAKGHCQRCNKTVTEDEVWVNALDKTFHKKCFTCIGCSRQLKLDEKYFDKNGQPQCPKCERDGQDECAGCHKAFANEEASVKALEKRWHTQCFFCAGCGKKFAQATTVEDRKFREKNARPYCEACFNK